MGELKKLRIIAYKDNQFSSKTGNEFVAMVNPAQYTETKGIRYNPRKATDTDNSPSYVRYGNKDISLTFLLDATGILPNSKGVTLPKKISALEKTVYAYSSSEHEPPYLEIAWGTLLFFGRMDKLTIKYKLFAPSGTPLRAEVTLHILEYQNAVTQQRMKNKNSPDLSHLLIVKAGDTLPGLCMQVYKSTGYCEDVARVNGLMSFRDIEPGTRLLFPPLSNE